MANTLTKRTLDTLASVGIVIACAVIVFQRMGGGGGADSGGDSPQIFLNPVEVTLPDGTARLGSPSASLAIVEFTDFQCPYCGHFARMTFPAIKRTYVETGIAQYITVNLPLDAHPLAPKAAEAAECASKQDKYWDMKEALFTAPPRLEPADLVAHAKTVGLDQEQFTSCLNGDMADRVVAGLQEARRVGVLSTPSFIIGRAKGPNLVEGLALVRGSRQLDTFKAALDVSPSIWRRLIQKATYAFS